MSAQPNGSNNMENPGLIAGHAQYVKGAAEVRLLSSLYFLHLSYILMSYKLSEHNFSLEHVLTDHRRPSEA